MTFPLDLGADFREIWFCDETQIPRFTPDCTARHWRALLFLGFAFSVLLVEARHGNRAA
jgi:hypothetical protein